MRKILEGFISHYFIPHDSNNFRAKTLHHNYLFFYIFFLLAVQIIFQGLRNINPDILGYATDISTGKVLELVNLERKKSGLEELTLSEELSLAAGKKAEDMFNKDYWAHISPTGTTPWEFITSSGYRYIYAGENLAKSFDKSEDVVAAWMKSPTHRANILKREYKEIGLSVKNGRLKGEETTLVVQEFGSRERSLVVSAGEFAEKEPIVESLPVAGRSDVINPAPKNPIPVTRNMSLLVTQFLLVVLLIDSLFIWRNKTIRVSGYSLAHVMFLMALLGAMGATGIGAIL